MNRCTDPYKVLGIDPGATEREITNRYRLLSKKFHPDVNPGDSNAEETFKLIQWAYNRVTSGRRQCRSDTGTCIGQPCAERFVGPRHPFMSFFEAFKSYGSKRGGTTNEGQG